MNREKLAYKQGIISIIVNILLFVVKYWAGMVSGSIALIADAWHTLSDSISSLIVIVGVKLSSKKADKEHPFGHGRWEQIAAVFIAFLLAIIAFDFFKESIERFGTKESANFGTVAVVVTIISVIAKEALARYALFVGNKTKNTSIKADAWHHRTDALSSVVILMGILLKDYFWWIDSLLGLIISLMLFYVAYEIVKEAIDKLLGEEPSEELISKVKGIVEITGYEELKPHHFHIHNYGKHKELTFHIFLDRTMNIEQAHVIASKLEQKIKENLKIESTIHVDPL